MSVEPVAGTEEAGKVIQLVSEIQARIEALDSMFEDSLKDEMDALKECIIQNPAAAALLKDEDIGNLVRNLRRTVAVALTEASERKAKPKGKAVSTRLTKEELEAALAAEGL